MDNKDIDYIFNTFMKISDHSDNIQLELTRLDDAVCTLLQEYHHEVQPSDTYIQSELPSVQSHVPLSETMSDGYPPHVPAPDAYNFWLGPETD